MEEMEEIKGLENRISLLSVNEFDRLLGEGDTEISCLNQAWWLQDIIGPGRYAVYAYSDGGYDEDGEVYNTFDIGYRPTLKLYPDEEKGLLKGNIVIKYSRPWIYLGDGIALSENIIDRGMFSIDPAPFDGPSYVKEFLCKYFKKREKELVSETVLDCDRNISQDELQNEI